MGAWGFAIFSDDTACDIRDYYRTQLTDGASDSDAKLRTQRAFLGSSSGSIIVSESLFWVAMASSQWEVGRLDEETKANAIAAIDSGGELNRWRDLGASAADLRKRAMVLATLRNRLESPPRPRKIFRPVRVRRSEFAVGDVISFALGSGKFVLFRVTSLGGDQKSEIAIAEILDWIGELIPSRDEMARMPCRKRLRQTGWQPVSYSRIALEKFPPTGFDRNRVAKAASGLEMPVVSGEPFACYPWPLLEGVIATEFGLY